MNINKWSTLLNWMCKLHWIAKCKFLSITNLIISYMFSFIWFSRFLNYKTFLDFYFKIKLIVKFVVFQKRIMNIQEQIITPMSPKWSLMSWYNTLVRFEGWTQTNNVPRNLKVNPPTTCRTSLFSVPKSFYLLHVMFKLFALFKKFSRSVVHAISQTLKLSSDWS